MYLLELRQLGAAVTICASQWLLVGQAIAFTARATSQSAWLSGISLYQYVYEGDYSNLELLEIEIDINHIQAHAPSRHASLYLAHNSL